MSSHLATTILDTATKLVGRRNRVTLDAILQHIDQSDYIIAGAFRDAVLELLDADHIVLYRDDSMARHSHSERGTVYVGGQPRHIIYVL